MVLQALDSCLTAELALGARGPWVVAFSGGGDSTALAVGLAEVAPRYGLAVHLFHVDHALDPGSGERATAAAAIAATIGLPFTAELHPVPAPTRRREGTEAAARRVRYAALEAFRRRIGADRILTAHHRDDQIETLLLRLAAGSGLAGLSGHPAPPRGDPATAARPRPLVLDAFVAAKGIDPLADPTNLDLTIERNRVRQRLLPLLATTGAWVGRRPGRRGRCGGASANRSRPPSREAAGKGRLGLATPRLEIAALLPLPEPLPLLALGLLERRAGRERPGSTRSKRELLRQLAASPGKGTSSRRRALRRPLLACVRGLPFARSARPPPGRSFHIFWRRRERSKCRRFAAVSGSPDSRLQPGCAPASVGARRSHSPRGISRAAAPAATGSGWRFATAGPGIASAPWVHLECAG